MTEPHETFTWYDTKLGFKIRLDKDGIYEATEPLFDYPTKRNRRIAYIRMALQILGALAIVWGLVWMII